MAVRLRLGNSLDGARPMKGTMRMFRAGERPLSSYTYDTLHDATGTDDGILPPAKHITVDEVQRFFDRCGKGGHGVPPVTTDPRMTTGAALFAVMDNGDVRYWKRIPSTELDVKQGAFRSWGANEDAVQDVGMSLQVRSMQQTANPVYFDNASLRYSNILWEFSPDSGAGRWYQLYDLPNRAYTRVTLPDATNTLRARALSSNPEEWVQSFAITPRPDYQHGFAEGQGHDMIVAPDDYWVMYDALDGYMRWSDLVLESGSPLYEVVVDEEVVAVTRSPYIQNDAVAAAIAGGDASSVVVNALLPGGRERIGTPSPSVTLKVVQLWSDDMDAAKKRPKSAYVKLLANGSPTGDMLELSAKNRLPVGELPEFARISGTDNFGIASITKPMSDANGSPIAYTFAEDAVDVGGATYQMTVDSSHSPEATVITGTYTT